MPKIKRSKINDQFLLPETKGWQLGMKNYDPLKYVPKSNDQK